MLFFTRALSLSGQAPPADLKEQLAAKPIDQKSWAEWSPKLRAWSGKHFDEAQPAFKQAFDFVRGSVTGKLPNVNLPKNLNKDAIAWMVLSGALLEPSEEPPVPRAKAALRAADDSIGRDRSLARAHFYRCQAIRKEQTVPVSQGGPAKSNSGRFHNALESLKHARELAPDVAWLPMAEMGQLAVASQQWTDAEAFFQLALDQEPKNVELARQLAKSINKNNQTQKYASLTEPILQRFDKDGILLAQYAWSLARDGRLDDAFKPLADARELGVDPAKHIDPGVMRNIDNEYANKLARQKDEETRKRNEAAKQEARRKEEEARKLDESAKQEVRRKEEETRKREETAKQEARRKDEDAKRKADDDRRRAQESWQRQNQDAFQQMLWTLAWCAVGFTAVYACIMGAMSLGGYILAKRTRGMTAAEMLGDDEDDSDLGGSKQAIRTEHETKLGKLYAFSLGLSLFFFYLALPFLFAGLVTVLALLIVWKFKSKSKSDSESANVRTALIAASAGGIAAIFKALFASTSGVVLGVRKYPDQCPTLFEAIDDVAERVGIDPPDEVYVAPGATFSVYQKGRGPFGMFGGKKRVLVVGLCVLNFLTINEFKSILAQCFAKFSHADTFWHRFIYQVTLSLEVGVRELSRTGGWIAWVNPFYWFFWLYGKSYAMLAAGFSRSRQFLADRLAVSLYGSDVFTRALGKICTDGAHFEKLIYGNITRMLKKKQAYVNMYLAFRKIRAESLTEDERLRLKHEYLEREPSLFDSHPTYQERVAAVEHFAPARKKVKDRAMDLFEDAEAVERELTDYMTGEVARYNNL